MYRERELDLEVGIERTRELRAPSELPSSDARFNQWTATGEGHWNDAPVTHPSERPYPFGKVPCQNWEKKELAEKLTSSTHDLRTKSTISNEEGLSGHAVYISETFTTTLLTTS